MVKAALTLDQVRAYNLPENPGKVTDSRAKAFEKKHGTNVQVEVDALDPATLADLLTEAAAPFWDESVSEQPGMCPSTGMRIAQRFRQCP